LRKPSRVGGFPFSSTAPICVAVLTSNVQEGRLWEAKTAAISWRFFANHRYQARPLGFLPSVTGSAVGKPAGPWSSFVQEQKAAGWWDDRWAAPFWHKAAFLSSSPHENLGIAHQATVAIVGAIVVLLFITRSDGWCETNPICTLQRIADATGHALVVDLSRAGIGVAP
jgi:hypothetical protein